MGRQVCSVDKRIEALVTEVLQISALQVTDDLTMRDVDSWDSLKHMELIVSLEQNFGIEFDFDEIVAMRSVGEIKRVLSERGAAS